MNDIVVIRYPEARHRKKTKEVNVKRSRRIRLFCKNGNKSKSRKGNTIRQYIEAERKSS